MKRRIEILHISALNPEKAERSKSDLQELANSRDDMEFDGETLYYTFDDFEVVIDQETENVTQGKAVLSSEKIEQM